MSDKEPTLAEVYERIKDVSSFERAFYRAALNFTDNGDGTMTYRRPNKFVLQDQEKP